MTDFLLFICTWPTNVPFTGTYAMTGSNQANLRLKPANVVLSSDQRSIVVSCWILGGVLVTVLILLLTTTSQRYCGLKVCAGLLPAGVRLI
jgi:hypothetical protein